MNYYHVSSHGLEKNDIFKSIEDFVTGMNDVAICILGFDVRILCFCLMSNHFHFLLHGTLEECRMFADEYKRRCAMRMGLSGDIKAMKEVEIHIDEVNGQEYLQNVIAYILRNPLAAGIRMMPYHYKWSSISIYFSGSHEADFNKINEMSARARYRVLKSKVSVPDTYVVDKIGMIPPSCYVDPQYVEHIFRSPARLMAFLARKVESEVEVSFGLADSVSMTDQEILSQVNELIQNEFHVQTVPQLSMKQRLALCSILRRNFNANAKQIARILHLPPDIVSRVI